MTLFVFDARLKAAERVRSSERVNASGKRRGSLYDLPQCDCAVDAKGDRSRGPCKATV